MSRQNCNKNRNKDRLKQRRQIKRSKEYSTNGWPDAEADMHELELEIGEPVTDSSINADIFNNSFHLNFAKLAPWLVIQVEKLRAPI